jgi:NTP pyrophosphatase (non-canonical NTP hydrolase)
MSNGQLELDLGHKTTGYSSEWDQYSRLDDLDMYQKSAKATAIYPRDYSIVYPAIGLAGEAGEVANKVKKLIRDNPDMTDDIKEKIGDEIGDVLWYCAVLADDLGQSLSEIANRNLEKLANRQKLGKLHGSGDKR